MSSEDLASEKMLRDRIAGAPADFTANHQLGSLYLHARHYPDAVNFLEKAHRVEPSDESNNFSLALAYEGAGSLDQARQFAHEALEHQPDQKFYRLAAELDEKANDPLSAVHEFERAATLAASEQNYFEWGSELLLHRAVWQAEVVFQKGSDLFPLSVRIQTGLGTALFAGARYGDAAAHLCKASDLNPEDPNPYLFMGKVQLAAPNPLPCIEAKLASFAKLNSGNSVASYLYAMAILKRENPPLDSEVLHQIEALLTHAVTVDPTCGDAYLQLGILKSSQHDIPAAIADYNKAVIANPQLADAYYRLGIAYDRLGQQEQAKRAFAMHDQLEQEQAEAKEIERRTVKQFLFTTSNDNPKISPE